MEHNQRELRRLAARAFLESLDQLQSSLEASDHQGLSLPAQRTNTTPPEPQAESKAKVTRSYPQPTHKIAAGPKVQPRATGAKFTFQDLEQAVADIEQYMSHHHASAASSQTNWEA